MIDWRNGITQEFACDTKNGEDEWMPALSSYSHDPPPDLRFAECCCRCVHGRRDGLSVECVKYHSRGISLYAVCEDFTLLRVQ